MPPKTFAVALVCLGSLLFGLPSVTSASPATVYTVNSAADNPDADPGNNVCADSGGQCTLRAAVMEANAHPGPDTILLPALTMTLTIPGGSEDGALTGDLDLTGTVTLQGAGAADSVIEAAGLGDRAVDVLAGAQVSVSDLTIRGGSVPTTGETLGGGVFNSGTLTLTRVTLARNGLGAFNLGQNGGGLENAGSAQALLDNSQVISNEAEIGAIFNEGLMTLRNTRVVSNLSDFGAGVFNTGVLSVTSSQVLSNAAGIDGGGLYNNFGDMTVTNSLVSGNHAQSGGGVWQHGGLSHISGSTLRDNQAINAGGGLLVEGDVVYLTASTIFNNRAGQGGGGAIESSGALVATNSTIVQNYANGNGGGLYQNGGSFDGYNLTIAQNDANADDSAGGLGGGLFREVGGSLALSNTILAQNLHVFNQLAFDDDCKGTLGIFHYSLVGDETGCVFTNDNTLIGERAALQPLADYGGPTQTLALGSGSAALDAGDPAGCDQPGGSLLLTDQRGFSRHADGDRDGVARCDMGAFEVQLQVFLPLLRR